MSGLRLILGSARSLEITRASPEPATRESRLDVRLCSRDANEISCRLSLSFTPYCQQVAALPRMPSNAQLASANLSLSLSLSPFLLPLA